MVETRRQQIEDVASALFRERGYSGTSVREIARALDIQGASLYAHVTSKEDVLWSIVQRAADRFEQAADEAIATSRDEDASTRLHALVIAHVRVVAENLEHASVFVYEWKFLSPERREQIGRRRDAYENRFRALIAEGIGAGAFRPTDPVVAAMFLLSALNGIATWYRRDGRLSVDDIARHFADLALRTLEASA